MYADSTYRFPRGRFLNAPDTARVVSCRPHDPELHITFKNEYACLGPPPSVLKQKYFDPNKRPVRNGDSASFSPPRGSNRGRMYSGEKRADRPIPSEHFSSRRPPSLLPKPMASRQSRGRGRGTTQSSNSYVRLSPCENDGLHNPARYFTKTAQLKSPSPTVQTSGRYVDTGGLGRRSRGSGYRGPPPLRPRVDDFSRDGFFHRTSGRTGSRQYQPPYHNSGGKQRLNNDVQQKFTYQLERTENYNRRNSYRQGHSQASRRSRGTFEVGGQWKTKPPFTRSSERYWQHDEREPYRPSRTTNGRRSQLPNVKGFVDASSADEYIDDFNPEDLAKYKLEINMDSFTVHSPTLSDPILTVPLSKWQSDELRYAPMLAAGDATTGMKRSRAPPDGRKPMRTGNGVTPAVRCSPEGTDDGKHESQDDCLPVPDGADDYLAPAFQLWADCGLSAEPRLRRVSDSDTTNPTARWIDIVRLYPVRSWPCLKLCEPQPISATPSDFNDRSNEDSKFPLRCRSYTPPSMALVDFDGSMVPSRLCRSLHELWDSEYPPSFLRNQDDSECRQKAVGND
ncbi:hypothetical protein CRM22_007709 [Opisthorchis felineus]|uniref:Uncharacterized protein n=2 Tax=Opisthorchis felineus TaxID=147828 RepID=A0A4S2LEK8_OPIFE|nr:hypothetical protein CRM22_007709 [Opisthorchis felineus]